MSPNLVYVRDCPSRPIGRHPVGAIIFSRKLFIELFFQSVGGNGVGPEHGVICRLSCMPSAKQNAVVTSRKHTGGGLCLGWK